MATTSYTLALIIAFVTLYISPASAFAPINRHQATTAANKNDVKASVARQLYIDDTTGSVGGRTSRASEKKRKTSPLTHIVSNPAEFDELVTNEQESIVVVRFESPYCKACKSIQVAYERLVQQYSTRDVKFVDVSIENQKDYQIPATPYAQIYVPSFGKVEGAPIPRKQMQNFRKVLKSYVDGMMDLEDEFFSSPQTYEPPRMVGLRTTGS